VLHSLDKERKRLRRLTNTPVYPSKLELVSLLRKCNLYKIIASLEHKFVNPSPLFLSFKLLDSSIIDTSSNLTQLDLKCKHFIFLLLGVVLHHNQPNEIKYLKMG
jgi:hypothetical protein